METAQVYVFNKKKHRNIVTAEILKTNDKTVIVRMPNGKIIKRKKERDLPVWVQRGLL